MQVLQIQGLLPGRHYEALFSPTPVAVPSEPVPKPTAADVRGMQESLQSITFRTFCDPSLACDAPDADVVVMSCDRYLDDHDDGMWAHLAAQETHQAGMAHLGDQLYNDMVVARLLATPEKLSIPQMTEAFRNAYREAWSHSAARAVLTRGAHWMIPDDHDVSGLADATPPRTICPPPPLPRGKKLRIDTWRWSSGTPTTPRFDPRITGEAMT